MRSKYITMACSRLTVARDHLAPDDAKVVFEVFRCLEEATTEVVSKFPNDLITITILPHLVWVAPDTASTNVDVVKVSPILVHHKGELQRNDAGWYGD
ncbi:hypothetical protein D3C84_955490 [compost metagenome]